MKGIPVDIGGEVYHLRFTRWTAESLKLSENMKAGLGIAISETNDVLLKSFKANHPDLPDRRIKELITQYDDEQEDAGTGKTFGQFLVPLMEQVTGFFTDQTEKRNQAG